MPAETLKKMKHKQKQIILDKAAEGVNEALAQAADIPLCESASLSQGFDLTFQLKMPLMQMVRCFD